MDGRADPQCRSTESQISNSFEQKHNDAQFERINDKDGRTDPQKYQSPWQCWLHIAAEMQHESKVGLLAVRMGGVGDERWGWGFPQSIPKVIADPRPSWTRCVISPPI